MIAIIIRFLYHRVIEGTIASIIRNKFLVICQAQKTQAALVGLCLEAFINLSIT